MINMEKNFPGFLVLVNETQVDLSRMPFGTYLFRIDGNNFNKVLKVVRE